VHRLLWYWTTSPYFTKLFFNPYYLIIRSDNGRILIVTLKGQKEKFDYLASGMIYGNTKIRGAMMSKAKIAITLDEEFIGELDRLVDEHFFQNRSQAIQDAVSEKLARMKRSRLSMECAKLDPIFERAMAEEGIAEDVSQWPEY
jgi:Arc/MetJ-type ribon-helix-helix transcriptional regulator